MRSRHTSVSRRQAVAVRPRPWRWLLVAAVLLAGVCLFTLGDSGLSRLWERWQELDQAEVRLDRLTAETDSLRHMLWLLENDLDYVEKVAREEYGMSKPSERVYRLPQEPGQPESE